MLFRKNMEPHCCYCEKGSCLNDGRVVCRKKGIVDGAGHCAAFRYDPLKRIPPRPAELDTEKLSEEDFSI